MVNPWTRISEQSPYVYSLDEDGIAKHYASSEEDRCLRLECLPEPFLGRLDAPVVLLGLKPGFDPADPTVHGDERFRATVRKCLTHQPLDYPLYLLDPAFAGTPGGKYYREALGPLATALAPGGSVDQEAAWKAIANEVFVINYFPYHSVEAPVGGKHILTSQRYGFHLAAQAVARDALVIVVLGEAHWRRSVAPLKGCRRLFVARNQRTWTLSPGNVPDGFEAAVQELAPRVQPLGRS